MFSRSKLNTVKILSIDGGGVRGIFPAYLLWRIQTALGRRGKQCPFSRILDLYRDDATRIFPPKSGRLQCAGPMA